MFVESFFKKVLALPIKYKEEIKMAKKQKRKSLALRIRSTPKKVLDTKPLMEDPALAKGTKPRVGIGKEYLENKNVCRVTFRLPKIAVLCAKTVYIVGDFNSWSIHANPMKMLKNGDFSISLKLEPGKEYQFRYLIDDARWENDWNADKYVKSPYGDCDNSVVVV